MLTKNQNNKFDEVKFELTNSTEKGESIRPLPTKVMQKEFSEN